MLKMDPISPFLRRVGEFYYLKFISFSVVTIIGSVCFAQRRVIVDTDDLKRPEIFWQRRQGLKFLFMSPSLRLYFLPLIQPDFFLLSQV